MSKRAGTVLTLDDLVDAVGVDAAATALRPRVRGTTLAIDLDLITSASTRTRLLRAGATRAPATWPAMRPHTGVRREDAFAPELLTDESEANLLGKIAEFPGLVKIAAEMREPHHVAAYRGARGAYHTWYDRCRVTPRAGERWTIPAALGQRRHLPGPPQRPRPAGSRPRTDVGVSTPWPARELPRPAARPPRSAASPSLTLPPGTARRCSPSTWRTWTRVCGPG